MTIILSVEEQSGSPTKGSPDPGEVFVIFDGRGRGTVLHTGERLSPGEIRLWGKRKVVRIKVAEQSTEVITSVTAADGFLSFLITLTVWWRVGDTKEACIRAANEGSSDVEYLVRTAVEAKVAQHHRRFEMDKDGANDLYEALCAGMALEVVEFVTVDRVVGKVDLDPAATGHLTDAHRVRSEAELERERIREDTQTLDIRKAHDLASEGAKIDIERMRQTFEAEVALKRAQSDVAVMQAKLGLYQELQGMAGLIALQLADDPSQIDVVIQGVREHELVKARLNLDAVNALVNADAVEGFDLSVLAKRTLKSFLQLAEGSMTTEILGQSQELLPEAPEVESGNDDPTDGASDEDPSA